MMHKILFISTVLPSKLGGVRSLYYNMLLFSKNFEVHFIRVKTGGGEAALVRLPAFVKFSEIDGGNGVFDPSSLLIPIHSGSIRRIKGAQGAIQRYIDENEIEVVITHSMDESFALRGLRAKVKVANQVDSFARYYSSKSAALGTPFSALMSHLQSFLYFFIERELYSNFDVVSFVSALDVSSRKKDAAGTFVISQGRDPPFKRKNLGARNRDVVILGRWDHPPNRDGLARIAKELGGINGSVAIIGPNLKAIIQFPKNVKVLGMVDDVTKYLSHSKICLIPVWYGAGLQTKVFDALRHGCVVVTNDFTKSAFDAGGLGSDSIIASDDLAAAANRALAAYSPSDAKSAYNSYEMIYCTNARTEEEFANKVMQLVRRKTFQSRP
jgi:glycosyltransferase involved in cell wall biosynthesis